MAFNSSLLSRFSTIHENRFWNKLISILNEEFSSRYERLLLIGNIMIEGKQIDAICIKDDAILVIDFKNYGGKLEVSENKPWLISGETINIGRKNPYVQLADYKYALLNLLKRRLPEGYLNWINIGHINVLVLFHQDIEYDPTNLQFDLSESVSKWFNICDLKHVCQTFDEITSGTTSIRGANRSGLLKILGVAEDLKQELVAGIVMASTETRLQNQSARQVDIVSTPYFADSYYLKAKKLEKIQFLIIGQDPYRVNPNGVAFCKNSHYELFQQDCSGGVVMNCLGISEELARANYKNPKVMFDYLLISLGICFLNINNKEFKRQTIEEIDDSLQKTKKFNLPFVQKAEYIILLGKNKTDHYFNEYYKDFKMDYGLIDPSELTRTNNPLEWSKIWGTNTLEQIVKN